GERPFREFLSRYLPKAPGRMVDDKGKTVGEHIGLAFYTIGQRKGIGIGEAGEPWYVAGKDVQKNELVVVQGHDHPLLMKRSLKADDTAWIAGTPPAEHSQHTAKTRYRQHD